MTLTNMSDHDIDRIIRYHLEPINISFHTTNPELRCQMLHNRFAGEALRKVDRLYEAGIEMNGQIVLCRGINDGEELERSIRDLAGYLPYLQSVSVVPVGLTRYRDGLYPLEPFTPEDARKVLEVVRRWQDELYEKWGTHFIHAGDEWYLLAGEDMPPQERYDGYLQLENGVGMMRLLENEFQEAFERLPGDAPGGVRGNREAGLPPHMRHGGEAEEPVSRDSDTHLPDREPFFWGEDHRGGACHRTGPEGAAVRKEAGKGAAPSLQHVPQPGGGLPG